MFNNIGRKIKGLAYIMVICAVIVAIWFLVLWGNNSKNTTYEEHATVQSGSISQEFTVNVSSALKAKTNMESALSVFISGLISSFLLYGFGELIQRVQSIDDKLADIAKTNITNTRGTNDEIEKPLSDNQPKYWTCTCKRIIPKEYETCPACGVSKIDAFAKNTSDTITDNFKVE